MLQLMPKNDQPSNDKPSFEEFYAQWYEKAVQYINKKIGNMQDAEDIASESFLYCYKNYDSYDPQKSAISTWLFLVVNSRIKNYYRDSREHVDLDSMVGTLSDDRPDVEECIYTEQLMKQVEGALSKLPEKKQTIIRLRYFEQKSNEEIAQILDISPVNARVMLSRALDSLGNLCKDFV